MTRITSLFTKSLFALLIAGGTLATNMQAQTESMTVTVPFPFTVDEQCNAPGTYRFSLTSSQYLLSVVNVKTGNKEMFAVHPENEPVSEASGRLVFQGADGPRVLNELHFAGSDTFNELNKQRHAEGTGASRSLTSKSVCTAQHQGS